MQALREWNLWSSLFPDVPRQTNLISHDVELGNADPIKQHPYRVKLTSYVRRSLTCLENSIIEPSMSDWSSQCPLVDKLDGSLRFCTNYRKVNAITKTDSNVCIDKIGGSTVITKLDLLKGYWCVPLTDRAKEISAFVTPDGLYKYCVIPFGMKNSQATFWGMARYYRRFCQNFSHIYTPLINLLKKWRKFEWSLNC